MPIAVDWQDDAPKADYQSIPREEPATEMVSLSVKDRPLSKDEIELADYKRNQLTQSRALTCYQILLVIACIVAYSGLFEGMGWLKHPDKHKLAQRPKIGINSVNSLAEAFVVDKKSGAMSYPDLVYFQFPDTAGQMWFGDEHGQWLWTHGALYASLPSSLLHAISAGMMDPVYYTIMLKQPEPDSECTQLHGDKTKCLYELLGTDQVDLKKRLPSDGFFAFQHRDDTDFWQLKVNTGVGRGLLLVPRTLEEMSGNVVGLTVMTLLGGICCTIALCYGAKSYAKQSQQSYLKEYIAQGLFLHNETEAAGYDQIQKEEIMMTEGDGNCHIDCDSSDDDNSSSDDEDEPTDEKVADARRKRLELRLMEMLNKEQGILHFVSNQVNGTSGQAQLPPIPGSTMAAIAPSMCELVVQRTQTTLAHILLLALSTLPVTMLNAAFMQGVAEFGYLGVDGGILAKGVILHTIRFMFMLSFILFNVLLVGLLLHYFFSEFDGERFPWLKRFTRSAFAKWLLVQWTGFSYLQFACFFMSALCVTFFIINALVGLLLHFFTNMFAVTAIFGTGAAVYANFKNLEGVINEVHSNISSASVIMENLKEGLTRRIVQLAVGEQKLVTDKRKLREMLIARGQISADTQGSDSWGQSVAAALTPGRLTKQEQAMLDDIEAKTEAMTAGFGKADDSGDGMVSREELQLQFGQITDNEWRSFDANGDGDCSIVEWQEIKMVRVQKGVLLVRSAFEHCVEKELSKHGFDKSRIIKYSFVGLILVIAVLLTFYFAMASANAFGAMAALISTIMSGAAIGFLNMPKKKNQVDPKVEKAIVQLNKALQKTIQQAVTDLVVQLRFFPVLIDIMHASIDEANEELQEAFAEKPKNLKVLAANMIKLAKDSVIAQQQKNKEAVIRKNEEWLTMEPEHVAAWENLSELGGGVVNGKKHSAEECLELLVKFKAKKLMDEDSM